MSDLPNLIGSDVELYGSPEQQLRWQRLMAKATRKAVVDVKKRAAREAKEMQRFADRIESGGITPDLLLEAFALSKSVRLYACRFLGLLPTASQEHAVRELSRRECVFEPLPAAIETSGNDAVAAAESIVRDAPVRRAAEIDWSKDPSDERERQLRAAILRAVERANAGTTEMGLYLNWEMGLANLAPSRVYGSDLRDELSRMREIRDDERAGRERGANDKILREALIEVGQIPADELADRRSMRHADAQSGESGTAKALRIYNSILRRHNALGIGDE